MIKRKLLTLTCLASVLVILSSCVITNQQPQGHIARGHIAGRGIRFVVNYESKFFGDNTEFCRDIAVASLMIMTLPGQEWRTLESIGLSNIRASVVGTTDNDRHRILISHRLIEHDDRERVIINAIISGVYGIHGWLSNFDVGADSPEYFELTGSEHPEWVNRYNHKGFDVTANRVIAEIRCYMSTIESDALPVLWVTGFSRGGAIANIVGAYFERDPEIITFTYAFASPNITSSPIARQYQTIFNIINEDDLVVLGFPSEWGFTRFGTDISTSVYSYGQEAFRQLTRMNYTLNDNHFDNIDSFLREAIELAPNREALYAFDDNIFFASEDFMTRDEAEDKKRRLNDGLRHENRQFAKFYIYELPNSGGYRVVHYQTPAFLLMSFAQVIYADLTRGRWGRVDDDRSLPYLADRLAEFAGALSQVFNLGHPHSPAAYYLIITDMR